MIERKVDLSTLFGRAQELIVKNETSWDSYYSSRYMHRLKEYTPEEIESILNSTSLVSQQKLSYNFFERNGFYKQIILYYSTLLCYYGLLIPNPSFGKQLSNSNINKRYSNALNYLRKLDIPELLTRISLRTLIYGSYYGMIKTLDKDNCVIIDLPIGYCRSRFEDAYGNDIVEFDVNYFNSIADPTLRKEALAGYPNFVSSYYHKVVKKGLDSWLRLSPDVGFCFNFFDDERPLFLDVIPSTIQYDEAVDTERDRQIEEIRKILVQKIPHMNDGQLLFEPEEAAEMHRGAVNMMKGNKNLSVLTTYADVDAIISKTAADNATTSLKSMLQNVFANAGVSSQIFAPEGTQALPVSIKADISVMMILGNKYSRFITYIINTLFSNTSIDFSYMILPVSIHTQKEFVDNSLKLAQGGYSFLLPAAAMGMDQSKLVNIKHLENDVLNLREVLIPLSTSYTQSDRPGDGKPGRPEKNLEDKSKKTIQNEDALDHQGGSNE